MKVVVVDVNEERADSVAGRAPRRARPSPAPSTCPTPTRVGALADFAFDTFGAVHLLCNNAGISPVGRIWDFTDDEWQTLLGVNLRGVANGLRSFVPRMIEQGEGHIVNTGSGASFVATPRLGPYCATKHAIVGLSEALRYELDGTGIGVSVLVPAGVNTNIGDSMVRPSAPTPTRRRRLHGAHRRARPDVARHDRTRRGRGRHARRRARGLGLHRDGPRPVGRRDRRYGEVLDAHRMSKERFPFLP